MKSDINTEYQEYNLLYKKECEIYRDIAIYLNISDSAFSILYCLYSIGEGCTQKVICDNTFLSKQTVNSSVSKMVKQGLLRLEKGRGRDMHIFLTDSGKAFVDDKIATVAAMEEKAFSSLGKDTKTLVKLNRKYLECLRSEIQTLK